MARWRLRGAGGPPCAHAPGRLLAPSSSAFDTPSSSCADGETRAPEPVLPLWLRRRTKRSARGGGRPGVNPVVLRSILEVSRAHVGTGDKPAQPCAARRLYESRLLFQTQPGHFMKFRSLILSSARYLPLGVSHVSPSPAAPEHHRYSRPEPSSAPDIARCACASSAAARTRMHAAITSQPGTGAKCHRASLPPRRHG